jgi:NTP pyrophosphatase (non-canonical NTP hydrolase)
MWQAYADFKFTVVDEEVECDYYWEDEKIKNKTMKNYNELQALVLAWAQQKGIFEKGTPIAQAGKTMEECTELMVAVAFDNKEEIKDALGDILVTIIIQAEMQGMSLIDCLESAYNIIAKRTGKMVDGKFVKDVSSHSGFDENNTTIA